LLSERNRRRFGSFSCGQSFTLTVVSLTFSLVPVFFNLQDQYKVGDNITILVTGIGSDVLTTFRIDGVPLTGTPPIFTPAKAGTYLIEALSADGTLKIWKYVKVQ